MGKIEIAGTLKNVKTFDLDTKQWFTVFGTYSSDLYL